MRQNREGKKLAKGTENVLFDIVRTSKNFGGNKKSLHRHPETATKNVIN